MHLTPLDVQQKQFARKLRGVDPQEVRRFLELCSDEFEELVRETIELKEEIRARDAELAETRGRERALQEALVSAQRLAQEMREQARKEAEIVLAEAELQAERIVQDAHQRRTSLIDELGELKRQKLAFEADVRAAIDRHARLLEAFSEAERHRADDDRVALLPNARKDSA
jgi:cell division initiation protein